MNEENKISVVINTYNAEEYLVKVLEAVKNFEKSKLFDKNVLDQKRELFYKHFFSS